MKRISEYSNIAESAITALKYPDGELSSLYEPIKYGMAAGGKRLRPALLLMSCEAFGGKIEDAIEPACGIEMFHNFTLLHDDVMDNSATRRNRPSVYAKWGANAAILSGDTMLTIATQMISKVPDHKLRSVLDIFNKMAIRVYEGQALDMQFEQQDDVSEEDYIRMIMDKTGALLGAAAQIGALLGGATDEAAEEMYEFGMMLGIAFQIQDDWLDVYGDAATFGKPIGGDINNNKKTFLLLKGFNSEESDATALKEAMKLPAGDTKVKVVRNLYDRMNLSEISKKEISHYSSLAMNALKRAGLDEEKKEQYKILVDKLIGRKR